MKTNRRDFIKQVGLIAGATALPSVAFAKMNDTSEGNPLPEVPEKKDAIKVRLIFALWHDVQVRETWPNKGYDFRMLMPHITQTLNSRIPDVQFIPGMAFDDATAKKIVDEDNAAGNVIGYMVIQMNSWPDCLTYILKQTDKPVLFCSYPYSGIGGWLTKNAAAIRSGRKGYAFISSMCFDDTVGAAAAFSLLKNGGTNDDFVAAVTRFRLNHTPEYSGYTPKKDNLKCLSAEKTLAKIKGMKILSVGNGESPNSKQIEDDFGIIVESVPFKDVNDIWRAVTEEQAKPVFDQWKKEARAIEDVSDATLMGVAKMYLAMETLLKRRGAQAITIDCLDGCYKGQLGAYPCLGFMQLLTNGLIGVCERDVNSTVATVLLNVMTKGRMGYVSDPVMDSSHRTIIYAHCVCTRRFFGPDSEPVPFEILTHSEDRMGASVRSIAPVGYPTTSVRIMFSSHKIFVHKAITVGNDYDDRACRTKIVAEVPGDYEKLYTQWDATGWHRVTVYGDVTKEVEAFAAKIGYEVVYEA